MWLETHRSAEEEKRREEHGINGGGMPLDHLRNSVLPALLEATTRCVRQVGDEVELVVDWVVDIQTVVVVAVEGASVTPHQTPLKVRL